VLNHPLQSPKLQIFLANLPAKRRQVQKALADWMAAISRQASVRLNLSRPRPTPIPIQSRRAGQWLLLAIAAIALLLWDWKLLVAFTTGLVATALIWTLQTRNLNPWIAGLRHWLNGPHRLLFLSVPCGGITMLGTYMATSIWDSSHNAWLVSCILLQGFGMILGLTLLSIQFLEQQSDRFNNRFDDALAELTHPNPLSRLVAVRQLNRLTAQNLLSPEQARIANQALQLLLLQEPEKLVREATLRSLEPSLVQPELAPPEASEIKP